MPRPARKFLSRAVDRPALTSFVLALFVRLIVVAVIFVMADGFLFKDDRTYSNLAALIAEHGLENVENHRASSTATLLLPISLIYDLFGVIPLLGQLFVAVAGALTAGLVAVLVRQVGASPRAALVAGSLVALFPSQVLWSSLILKDALVWLGFVTVALGVVVAQRSRRRAVEFLGGVAIVLAGLLILAFLRSYSIILSGWVAALALPFGERSARLARGAAGLIIALALPWGLGYGVGGMRELAPVGDVADYRARGAALGEADIVPETSDDASIVDEASRLPGAVVMVVLGPLPGQELRSWRESIVLVENLLLWYPLLALAGVGLARELRRSPGLVAPTLMGLGIIAMYSLTEGNFGTAYRHRGELVWIVASSAALGMNRWLEKSVSETPA